MKELAQLRTHTRLLERERVKHKSQIQEMASILIEQEEAERVGNIAQRHSGGIRLFRRFFLSQSRAAVSHVIVNWIANQLDMEPEIATEQQQVLVVAKAEASQLTTKSCKDDFLEASTNVKGQEQEKACGEQQVLGIIASEHAAENADLLQELEAAVDECADLDLKLDAERQKSAIKIGKLEKQLADAIQDLKDEKAGMNRNEGEQNPEQGVKQGTSKVTSDDVEELRDEYEAKIRLVADCVALLEHETSALYQAAVAEQASCNKAEIKAQSEELKWREAEEKIAKQASELQIGADKLEQANLKAQMEALKFREAEETLAKQTMELQNRDDKLEHQADALHSMCKLRVLENAPS